MFHLCCVVFFFKQKTAYEMRISDWSSDVCSSDLPPANAPILPTDQHASKGLSRGCSTQAKNGRACGGSEIDGIGLRHLALPRQTHDDERSEEHTSELQSLMRISYAVFCSKKKNVHTLVLHDRETYNHVQCVITHQHDYVPLYTCNHLTISLQ